MNTDSKSKKHLTAAQERLIMRYVDGECGPLTRIKARKVLQRSGAAKEFMQGLQTTTGVMREYDTASDSAGALSVDLWSKIEQRIDQEERAALYLGERRTEATRSVWAPVGVMQDLLASRSLVAGLSGGAIAALILAVVWTPNGQMLQQQPLVQPAGAPAAAPVQGAAGQRGVNFVSHSTQQPYGPVRRPPAGVVAETSGVEVDWMRSDGQVRMIQNPDSNVPIIWVKKRTPRQIVLRSRVLRRGYGQRQSLDKGVFVPGEGSGLQSGGVPRRYGSEGAPALTDDLQKYQSKQVPEASFVTSR